MMPSTHNHEKTLRPGLIDSMHICICAVLHFGLKRGYIYIKESQLSLFSPGAVTLATFCGQNGPLTVNSLRMYEAQLTRVTFKANSFQPTCRGFDRPVNLIVGVPTH